MADLPTKQIKDLDQLVSPASADKVPVQDSAGKTWYAEVSAIGAGGAGDMTKAVYDPTTVAGDAFDTDNHVDGATNKVFSATEQTKLSGIETAATADQTGAQIKVAYEAEADTNAYNDAAVSKLAGIELLADVTDATNIGAAGGLIDTNNLSDVSTAATALTNIGGIGAATTDTFTNKTLDADGTGNVVSNIGFPEFDTDVADTMLFVAGSYLDSPSVVITSNGTVITCTVEKDGGGDLRIHFLTGLYTWDCTPAVTLSLTAGTDTSPTMNYVYIDEATKTFQTSTSGFPIADIVRVAEVYCPSATKVQSEGPYSQRNWTDHMASATCGHLAHMNLWIRAQAATWQDGVALTPAITINGGSEDNVDISTSSGNVLQLHSHAYPAFDTAVSSHVMVINDFTTAYTEITDLNAADTDTAGNAITNNKWTNLVLWGVVSEDSNDCHLMVNLPSGFHGSASAATVDAERYSTYTIPAAYIGTGFLIARLILKYTTGASGTWTLEENLDLRTAGAVGGGAASDAEFDDNVFKILNATDTSKVLDFDVSAVTTATTRTVSMADAAVDLAHVNDLPLANLADGTDGELITWDASGNPAVVAVGTASHVLTSNGVGVAPTFQVSTGSGDLWSDVVDAIITPDGNNTRDFGTTGTRFAVGYFGDLNISSNVTVDGLVEGRNIATDGATLDDLPVANLADGTDGELITWSAAGAPATVAVGTAGNVLTSNGVGAAPTFQAGGAGDMVLADVQTITGAKTFGTIGGAVGKFILAGSTSGSTIVNATAVAGTTTLTLPAATDTLVGKATTDTLTNKTLTSPTLTTPVLGTPTSGTLTNCDGTASSLTAGAVTSFTPASGSLTLSGADALTLTTTAATNITLPTTGTIPIEDDLWKYEGQNLQTGTTYTLVLTDAGKMVEMNNAAANTLTVPPNSSVAFPVDTRIDITQYGAGLTTIAQGAAVTIRGDLVSLGQYEGLSLWKRATDEWVLYGGTT